MDTWTSLGRLPGYDFLSTNLRKERSRIDKAVERVLELRSIADQADEDRAVLWRRDSNTCDQSRALAAEIEALERELEVRADTEVFLYAIDQFRGEERCTARAELLSVELEERERLGCEDGFQIAAALCCLPQWHAARRRVAGLSGGDCSDMRRANSESLRHAHLNLKALQARLAAEPERLKLAREARERDARNAIPAQAIADARLQRQHSLSQRAAELLESGGETEREKPKSRVGR